MAKVMYDERTTMRDVATFISSNASSPYFNSGSVSMENRECIAQAGSQLTLDALVIKAAS
ncbi:uncharacterized protein ACLA_060940 [Aspergillus clavatus NRRL 1]|uniref:Uncharacterized protein n=1 Tax=Aspergillus clavatus (strain ATCC 1007 / CBS 513.65 / DSM 816 / NCTC 3887 / NRRL 1 / QM 1276 / 107) TaxID=344612 RepID=A1CC77_ASPCL|nr:uncharacterized protein ACLA_060940 [Aspergillus clavatus NRRL 1]EAW12134.1 hypothetical protein ACLA_060940 [Aspergillus clavatus NRRL 1]